MRIRWQCVVVWGIGVALGGAGRAGADTSIANLLTIDQLLLRADWAGEVRVVGQSWTGGRQDVRFELIDPWFTRWDAGQELALSTGPLMPTFVVGTRYVVFVTGGPWEESPFTFGAESVFQVGDDGRVRCRSGNPLFGVLNDGFVCTAPELVVGEPVSVGQMRAQTVRARARAARRLPGLAAALAAGLRPLERRASPAAARGEDVRR